MGRGRLKTKHGKGFGVPMLSKHRVAQDGSNMLRNNHVKGFGFSRFPKVGWEWFGSGSMHTSTTSCCGDVYKEKEFTT